MTATFEERERLDVTPDREGTIERVTERGTRYGLTILIAVLAALVGFGIGWLVFRDTGVDVPSDVESLLDDAIVAWDQGDGEGILDFYGPTGVHISSGTGPAGVSGEELATYVNRMPLNSVEDSEIIAVHGDTPYVVIQTARVVDRDGFSVFVIDEDAGQLLIRSHTWYEYDITS